MADTAAPGGDRPARSVRRVDHVGLSVLDLEAVARWYVTAFGFVDDLRLRVDAIELDIVMLRHPATDDRLELLHRPGTAAGQRPADPASAAGLAGFGHLAFDVDDVQAAFDRLLRLGATAVMTPRPSPEPGVPMAFVADPEGNLVELLSRPGPS